MDPPADACTTYRLSFAALQAFETDLHQHVHIEKQYSLSKSIAVIRNAQSVFTKLTVCMIKIAAFSDPFRHLSCL
jgi:hypothetical protein